MLKSQVKEAVIDKYLYLYKGNQKWLFRNLHLDVNSKMVLDCFLIILMGNSAIIARSNCCAPALGKGITGYFYCAIKSQIEVHRVQMASAAGLIFLLVSKIKFDNSDFIDSERVWVRVILPTTDL